MKTVLASILLVFFLAIFSLTTLAYSIHSVLTRPSNIKEALASGSFYADAPELIADLIMGSAQVKKNTAQLDEEVQKQLRVVFVSTIQQLGAQDQIEPMLDQFYSWLKSNEPQPVVQVNLTEFKSVLGEQLLSQLQTIFESLPVCSATVLQGCIPPTVSFDQFIASLGGKAQFQQLISRMPNYVTLDPSKNQQNQVMQSLINLKYFIRVAKVMIVIGYQVGLLLFVAILSVKRVVFAKWLALTGLLTGLVSFLLIRYWVFSVSTIVHTLADKTTFEYPQLKEFILVLYDQLIHRIFVFGGYISAGVFLFGIIGVALLIWQNNRSSGGGESQSSAS